MSLALALQAAVPLWIAELQRLHGGPTLLDVRKVRTYVAPLLAAHGDALLYRSPRAGETAEVFNALAYGLAVAAFQSGGITCLGVHFEASRVPAGAP